ncbi:MAG: folylpolyglutamate synthase/dihydrofolate synthase family protein [Flavobacteriaceae bacterium]|nr:folylpolyglutamate synthase/dihydrofolate synthase family protein [Flavobacteriaceae bacterium]
MSEYQKSLQWLFGRIPSFQQVGKAAYKADLSNIITFCHHLGNPQNSFKSVHVAGTNGKGSTSHMIASVLQEAGYKTGLHTSPHLKHFGERSRINGEITQESFIVDFIEKNKAFIEKGSFSFFEVAVALGFQYFAENQVDIAVIETGLGGKLDSTNIIHPEISIITNIGLDHIDILGKTLPEIAAQKAGIIKAETPVVIGEYAQETKEVFMEKASSVQSNIYFAQDEMGKLIPKEWSEFQTDLKGNYQNKNKITAMMALILLQQNGWKITTENIQNGLRNVVKNTGLRGRWDVLNTNPSIIADTAHNPAGIRWVVEQIAEIPYQQLHLVLGFVNDKDVKSVIESFPNNAIFYFSAPDVPRKFPVFELKKQVPDKLKAFYFDSVSMALEAAQNQAQPNDLIYVGGSTFVVAEVI